jgi:hypothetical protein
MNTTPQNEGSCVAIGIWAVLVGLMMMHAILIKRPSFSADENDASMRGEKGVEPVAPPVLVASDLKTAWPGANGRTPAVRQAPFLSEPDEEDGETNTEGSLTVEYLEAALHQDLESGKVHAIEGIVQRINYPAKELRVVAEGQVWNFTLDPECLLWFDDKPTVLRCFHPLDFVKIIFADDERTHVIKALYAWEKQLA